MDSIIQNAVESRDPSLARAALDRIDALLASTPSVNERIYLLFSKASCYGILGDIKTARQQLSLALQQEPDGHDTQLTYKFQNALLLQQEGNYQGALEALNAIAQQHFAQLKKPESQAILEDIQQRRAFLLVTCGEFANAVPLLHEILRLNLEQDVRSDALASLGMCHLELRQWEMAKDYLSQVRAHGPTENWKGKVNFYLGIAFFYCGMLKEAKKEFVICEEHADQYCLPILDVYQWLSAISKRLGDNAESERYAIKARAS